jgi:predicted PurR-regulated permease PerM
VSDRPAAMASFPVARALFATVATFLLLMLLGKAADIFLLLFVAVVFSLYLGAVADWLMQRLRVPRRIAFLIAIFGTLGAIVGLFMLLVPPVVEQTQQLVANLPRYIGAWQAWLERLLARYPALRQVWSTESQKFVGSLVGQAEGAVGEIVPRVFDTAHVLVDIISILVMGIFLAMNPATYREWLIALFPPSKRDVVRDVLTDMAETLRHWIVGQVLAMALLGILTALGLYLLEVPYWLTFGVFTGAVAIIPFFGSLVSSLLPALFVLGGDGAFGMAAGTHALLVIALGFLIHIIEANIIVPIITQKQVEIPPVLSMMAILLTGRLLGAAGLPVAVPMLAVLIVVVRRVLINRIYEGHPYERTGRERVLVLRVPAPDGGVLVTADPPLDVLRLSELHRKGA